VVLGAFALLSVFCSALRSGLVLLARDEYVDVARRGGKMKWKDNESMCCVVMGHYLLALHAFAREVLRHADI
jgi:hypothetical protein